MAARGRKGPQAPWTGRNAPTIVRSKGGDMYGEISGNERGAGGARAHPDAGFTLVEVSIIVLALAILSSILLPQMGVFLRDARFARAREDVAAIGVAMMHMLKDTGESAFYVSGQAIWRTPPRVDHHDILPVGLLIGDGDTPDVYIGWDWKTAVGDQVAGGTGDFGGTPMPPGMVDTFANQLIQNNPADLSGGGVGPDWHRYRTPSDMVSGDYSAGVPGGLVFDPGTGQGFNSEFAWRGPYLDGVRPDPWGNRYMSNVLWLSLPQGRGAQSSGFIRSVIVISAGPDEEIDTPFGSIGGFLLGDDDIAYPVAYGSLR